jgi:hypothetical protein
MIIAGVLVAALSVSAGMAAGLTRKQVTQAGLLVPDPPTVQPLDAIPVSVPGPAVPLDDDASAGKVVFTFDHVLCRHPDIVEFPLDPGVYTGRDASCAKREVIIIRGVAQLRCRDLKRNCGLFQLRSDRLS